MDPEGTEDAPTDSMAYIGNMFNNLTPHDWLHALKHNDTTRAVGMLLNMVSYVPGPENPAADVRAGVISYRVGKAVKPEVELGAEAAYDWMLRSPLQKAEFAVQKYGLNLKGSGQRISLKFNPDLPIGTYGRVRKAAASVIEFGPSALENEETLVRTLAHELRHSRAYMGSGSNSELAARLAEGRLGRYMRGKR